MAILRETRPDRQHPRQGAYVAGALTGAHL
jgi:hypothetical protein